MCFLVGMGGLRTEGGSQNCLGPQLLKSNSLLFVLFSFVVRVDIAETTGYDRGLEPVKNFLITTQHPGPEAVWGHVLLSKS